MTRTPPPAARIFALATAACLCLSATAGANDVLGAQSVGPQPPAETTVSPAVVVSEAVYQLDVQAGAALKCSPGECIFTAPPVPAKRRLELASLSCAVLGAGNFYGKIVIVSASASPAQFFSFTGTSAPAFIGNTPVAIVVPTGGRYQVYMVAATDASSLSYAECSIYGTMQTLK